MAEILSNRFSASSAFETETLCFIKDWLGNRQSFVLKTSGSTGKPKEIILTREQLRTSAKRTIDKLQLSEKETAFICLDTKYIAGKMMLVRALEANMKIVAVEPAASPLKATTVHVDFGAFVPLQLHEIGNDPDSLKKLNAFQAVIVGGAALPAALHEKIKTLSCDVYATYGMTETVSHIALQKLNGPAAQDYFEVLPDIQIHADERGCLVVTLPDFDEPIVTNDLVTLIDTKRFRISGRYDSIINSGGVKLLPEPIEKKIEQLLSQPFFVAGVPDERLGQKLVLIVEGPVPAHLSAQLKDTLPAYEVPRAIWSTDRFVYTETQKINRVQTLERVLKSRS